MKKKKRQEKIKPLTSNKAIAENLLRDTQAIIAEQLKKQSF